MYIAFSIIKARAKPEAAMLLRLGRGTSYVSNSYPVKLHLKRVYHIVDKAYSVNEVISQVSIAGSENVKRHIKLAIFVAAEAIRGSC